MSRPFVYRPDIDGLRALSIIPVVLFHAQVPFFEGGFVGVDTFFVISGYLITSLIVSGIENNDFHFSKFYLRRARRLLPALFLVYIFSLSFSLIVDSNIGIASTSKQIASGIIYLSNWYYFFEIGYFSSSSLDYMLLHTWSLSIEEQFYLVFPVAIWAFWKRSRRAALIFVIIATLASFAYSLHLSLSDSFNGAYYNSLSRFWEIGVGACVALANIRLMRFVTAVRLIALLVILGAPLVISASMPFPAPAALPSVVATVCLLITMPQKSEWVGVILSSRPFVYIGRLSYSIYLWHWVIFSAAYKLSYFSLATAPVLILLTVGVSIVAHHFIEQPLRVGAYRMLQKSAIAALAFAILTLFAVSPMVQQARRDAVASHDPASAYARIMGYGDQGFRESGELASAYRGGECFLEPSTTQEFSEYCYTASADQPNIALIGDSNAAHYAAGFVRAFPQAHLLQLTASNCRVTVPGRITRDLDACRAEVRLALDEMLANQEVNVFVISARWTEDDVDSGSFEALLARLQELGIAGRAVIMGRQTYFSHAIAAQAILALRSMDPDSWTAEALNSQINATVTAVDPKPDVEGRMADLAERYGVEFISAYDLQRVGDDYEFIIESGDLAYWDTGHLTTVGSVRRVEQMVAIDGVRGVFLRNGLRPRGS